jgi:hypothetical protein
MAISEPAREPIDFDGLCIRMARDGLNILEINHDVVRYQTRFYLSDHSVAALNRMDQRMEDIEASLSRLTNLPDSLKVLSRYMRERGHELLPPAPKLTKPAEPERPKSRFGRPRLRG